MNLFGRRILFVVIAVACIAISVAATINQKQSSRLSTAPPIFQAPDTIYYSEGSDASASGRVWQLRQMKGDGTADAVVTNIPGNVTFAIPNPSRVSEWIFVFDDGKGNPNSAGIYRITGNLPKTMAELAAATVVVPAQYVYINMVQVSPDGTTVYYDGSPLGIDSNLYRAPMDPKAGAPKALDTLCDSLHLSEDGTKLAYGWYGSPEGTTQICTIAVDGTNKKQLTTAANSSTMNIFPQWNKAGTKLIYAGFAPGTTAESDLYTITSDGAIIVRVTHIANASSLYGTFSPDGTHIVFDSTNSDTGVATILVANADGSGAKVIHTAPSGLVEGLMYWNPARNTNVVQSLTLNPTSVLAGLTSTATVTLNAPRTTATTLNLSSSDPAAVVPATLTMAAGVTTGTFTVTTTAVTTSHVASIVASANGLGSAAANLTVGPLLVDSITLSKATLTGGDTEVAQVALSTNAPVGGTTVTLSSGNTAATVPATVTVLAGQKTAQFTITTSNPAANQVGDITAAYTGTSKSASLKVLAESITAVTPSVGTVISGSGTSVTCQVTLAAPAPTGGLTVAMSSSDPAVSVPASLQFPAGTNGVTFGINYSAVTTPTTATLTAKLGTLSKTATLTVSPLGINSITISPNPVAGGATATATITLNAMAQTGGMKVTLSADTPTLVTVPATVTVPVGATTATFQVTTKGVKASTPVVVKAKTGLMAATCTLTITPPIFSTFVIDPAYVAATGTTKVNGIVTILGAAGAGGFVVNLVSANPTVVTVPKNATVPAGATTVSVPITYKSVTKTPKSL